MVRATRPTFTEVPLADLSFGLRLDWPGAWALVRASNTEPIGRIVAEAADPEAAEAICRRAAARLA